MEASNKAGRNPPGASLQEPAISLKGAVSSDLTLCAHMFTTNRIRALFDFEAHSHHQMGPPSSENQPQCSADVTDFQEQKEIIILSPKGIVGEEHVTSNFLLMKERVLRGRVAGGLKPWESGSMWDRTESFKGKQTDRGLILHPSTTLPKES